MLVVLAAFGAAAAGSAAAATVELLNDERIEGELLDVDAVEVTLRVKSGIVRIPLRDVRDVRLASGELAWEHRLRRAIERTRQQLRAEAERRLVEGLREASGSRRGPAAEASGAEAGGSAARLFGAPPAGANRFAGLFEDEDHGIRLRYPGHWAVERPAPGYFTFRDPRPDATGSWSFNLTVFDRVEVDFSGLTERARLVLEHLPDYHVARRGEGQLGAGGYRAEHTVGLYDDGAGRVIRHDQVVIEARRALVVFEFFSPGVVQTEGELAEVQSVLASLELSR
ncbi:MAG: hypothetical protein KatS3mg102_2964 [Planctomycetota bacterium]|nr:MAG: hypothetical protein KatS3mg102_2964 [Planctomycetota bacterium]